MFTGLARSLDRTVDDLRFFRSYIRYLHSSDAILRIESVEFRIQVSTIPGHAIAEATLP